MISALLTLPRFVATFFALILLPLTFFRGFHQRVTERQNWAEGLLRERKGDRYLDPAKFAAVSITISNLLIPVISWHGVEVPPDAQNYGRFAEWPEAKQILDQISFTGIWFIDGPIRDTMLVGTYTVLGLLIALLSFRAIPAKFATGYYFYFSAWIFLADLVGAGLILFGLTGPVLDIPLPTLANLVILAASLFMFFGFPILFWPRIMDVSRGRVALAILLGLAAWIIGLAVLIPYFFDLPGGAAWLQG